MLSCVYSQAIQQISDLKNLDTQFDYLIKKHPDLPIDIEINQDNIEIFSGSAKDLYNTVDAIVYCSSTSGVEAYGYGLPVFRVKTQFMDLETGEEAFSPKVIKSTADIEKAQIVPHAPTQLFSPVNEDLWKSLLSV